MDHDIVRHIFQGKGQESPDGKFMLYEKDDFERFELPFYWYYYLDELGQGIMLKFLLKIKTKLSFVQKRVIVNNGKVEMGPSIPKEKIIIELQRMACDKDVL